MVLFPIALLWVVVFLIWVIRQSTNEAEPPDDPTRSTWFGAPRRPKPGRDGTSKRDHRQRRLRRSRSRETSR